MLPSLRRFAEFPASKSCNRRLLIAVAAGLVGALALGLDRCGGGRIPRPSASTLVFESARFFGWRLPFPAVAWFPDIQHRRLPQLFSPAARWRREIGFRAQIASGRTSC